MGIRCRQNANLFAFMSGQSLQKAFIPLPSSQAVYTSAGLAYYRHQDHLGSSRLATTPSRTLFSSTAYAPFGEQYAPAGTTDLSFTGQDQDTVSGFYDFMFRRQSPTQGRWLSPDPAGLAALIRGVLRAGTGMRMCWTIRWRLLIRWGWVSVTIRETAQQLESPLVDAHGTVRRTR